MNKSNMSFLRLHQVINKVGLKKSAIYKLISEDEFPKPVKLTSRAVAWLECEINDWLEQKVAERNGKERA